MSARWLIDLSPGTRISPARRAARSIVAVGPAPTVVLDEGTVEEGDFVRGGGSDFETAVGEGVKADPISSTDGFTASFALGVAAFVVVRSDRDLDVDELLGFCAERLADYKRPRQVHLVHELPRNATGKVMKHLLSAPST